MKCHPYNVRYESCCTCKKIGKCMIFNMLTTEQYDAYVQFVTDHVRKHPDKYQVEVIMAEQKVAKGSKNIVVLDSPPASSSWTSLPDLNKMTDDEKLALKGKTIFQIGKQYKAVVKIEVKQVPLGSTESAPSQRKPRSKKTQ